MGVKDAPVADAAEPDTPRSLTAKAEVWSATLRAFESDGRADALAAELVALLDAHNAGLQESQLGRRVPTTPGFVRCCLRAKCYEAEKALKLAKNYATFRSRVGWPGPSVAVATNEAELRSGYNQLLPLPDAYGQTVVTQQMGSLDLKLPGTSIERYQRMSYYVMHRALMRPASQLDGFALLLDFRGFAFSSLTAFKLSDFRRGVSMLQDCFPARLTAVYVVHQPRWLSVLLRLIKPFLSGPPP